MEKRILLRAGMKRHKGSLMGVFLLIFLIALSLCTVLAISVNGNRYVQNEIVRTGYGSLTAWVSGVPDMNELVESIRMQEGVEDVTSQNLVFSDYQAHGIKSDSEGQLLPWKTEKNQYRFLNNDLSGYTETPESIAEDEIYVSPAMKSILQLNIGDELSFSIARGSKNVSFVVAGYFEDPVIGSSMIGMKHFLIAPEAYENIVQMIQKEGSDALAREGGMLHIKSDREAELTTSDLTERLNENTPLLEYTEFVHSADTMSSFMTILQNAFCGFMAAFSIALLCAVLAISGYSISSVIEQDWKNIGILKTLGIGGKELIRIQERQYLFSVVPGLIMGSIGAIPVEQMVSRKMITTSGFLIPAGIPILPGIGICMILFGIIMFFVHWKLRKIDKISPMNAIRTYSSEKKKSKPKRQLFGISGKAVYLGLAIRQVLSDKKRYVTACMVVVLLVFVTSMAGRMNDWLGADGQGMMDAFNPADLDMGIQVLGNLSQDEMEQVVCSYTKITDSYELAMQNVSVNGTNYTANVITEPDRFHISRGRTSRADDEVVLTEMAADDLGVDIDDTVTIRGEAGMKEFKVTGIYHCANDMGANLGMSREGYLTIGKDDPRIWCHHYFLEDSSKKQEITRTLENVYGGDVHVHENTWPGLAGIIRAMHMLIFVLYALSMIFVAIVTIMTGSKILEFERKDMGIYKAIGISSQRLRMIFTIRFGMVAVIGAVIGIILASLWTDPLVQMVMRLEGISNFSSDPDIVTILVPGVVVAWMFAIVAFAVSGKIKRTDLSVLTEE